MHKQFILAFILLLTLASGKKLKVQSESKVQAASEAKIVNPDMEKPTDDAETLFKLINEYRKTKANIYKQLNEGGSGSLASMAETEVDHMIEKTRFGQFDNFDTNSKLFSSYTEVVCELAENHEGKAYKAAYDLWMTDSSITKELKNEYTLADANCQGYGNGWVCALLLATPL